IGILTYEGNDPQEFINFVRKNAVKESFSKAKLTKQHKTNSLEVLAERQGFEIPVDGLADHHELESIKSILKTLMKVDVPMRKRDHLKFLLAYLASKAIYKKDFRKSQMARDMSKHFGG